MRGYTKLEYTVCFATPAFLAGANDPHEAEWRTPPFKALLREWWRVVKAREVDYDVDRLRDAEHKLFGHAGSKKDSLQSKVRLRLGEWRPGTEMSLHTSLKDIKLATGKFQLPAGVYLGYGPIQNNESRPAISNRNDSNTLSVFTSKDSTAELKKATQLAAWFGAIGSRSRNSWGSLSLEGERLQDTTALSADALEAYLRTWTECLELDWPHAVGKDKKGPLIWKTALHPDWKQALKNIANLRAGVRQRFPLNLKSTQLQKRHVLAYPIKEPVVAAWGKQTRFPNQLRLKIVCEQGKYRGIVTHVPCALPQPMVDMLPAHGQASDLKNMQHEVWSEVHGYLDSPSTSLTRVS